MEQSIIELANIVTLKAPIELFTEAMPLVLEPIAGVLVHVAFYLAKDPEALSASISDFALVQPFIREYFAKTIDLAFCKSSAELDVTLLVVNGSCSRMAFFRITHPCILAF